MTEEKYCGECRKEFKPGEITYFTWYEGKSLCGNCKRKLESLVDAEYLDWQQQTAKGVR